MTDLLCLKEPKESLQKNHLLAAWLKQLTVVRNTCAHHSRLWNKSLSPASTEMLRPNANLAHLPQGQSERVFGSLAIMAHILRVVSPGTTWPDKLVQVINSSFLTNSLVDAQAMGIPEGWGSQTI